MLLALSQMMVVSVAPTDVILVAIAVLLWRLVRVLEEGLSFFKTTHQPQSSSPSLLNAAARTQPSIKGGLPLGGDDSERAGAVALGQRCTGEEAGAAAAAPSFESQAEADAAAAERPLRRSAREFAACCIDAGGGDGADVDVVRFIAACRSYCRVLELLGSVM